MHGSFQDDWARYREYQHAKDLEMSNIRLQFTRALSDGTLTCAVPTEKNLRSSTAQVFSEAGIHVGDASPRAALRPLTGLVGFSRALYIRQPEIIRLVRSGKLPLGIVGQDALLETLSVAYRMNIVCPEIYRATELHYGNSAFGYAPRVVLFTKTGIGIDTRAKFMRRFRNRRVLVASEFPNMTREFFRSNDINAIPIDSSGATEALVASGMYAAGICIVETRATLDQNKLIELETLVRAPAVVIVNRTFFETPGADTLVSDLSRRLTLAVTALTP